MPRPAPFVDATVDFASESDSARAFLERCLETLALWEPEIRAFVHINADTARAAADRSTVRWRAGRPLSAIDGMPVGIKDIIETADMPTEQGSPVFAGTRTYRDAASVAALRAAGAVIVGKTVTTEFAATEPRGTRSPWELTRTPGGSSSGSAAAVAAGLVSAALGTQGIASIVRPASFCGCVGFKPSLGAINRGGSYDTISQSCTGVLGATLQDTWQVAREAAVRAGGDPGFCGLAGPEFAPLPVKPRALALLETVGWDGASPGARAELRKVVELLAGEGITILDRRSNRAVAILEDAIVGATELANTLNAWEMRWPLNTYRDRDPAKLSSAMLDRLTKAEAMTIDQYRAALVERDRLRHTYAQLQAECDGYVALAASGPAPVGLHSTGDPAFAVPFTLLGVPVISVPVLHDQDLPLGLQVAGFRDGDAATFAIAAWVMTKIAAQKAGAVS
jgi:Asp-tRNA(Asn)/Glu-tRNA(Gln) amidotransferase A subunit family amidase